ncbi:MAG: superoxide dismutase family protein [Proteobacteria bacterium]|nr:superoxide dismutase family protein [Pseudomonadota bacterium]
MKRNAKWLKKLIMVSIVLAMPHSFAAENPSKTVEVFLLTQDAKTHGMGEKIGTITFTDSAQGLEIKTQLSKLAPGQHGFHVHENPKCEGAEKDGKWQAGLAAGGHLDPAHTGHHLGPNGQGHLGDLPLLTVDDKGQANETLFAKRLKVADLKDRSIMIHKGADNYSDVPPMGGGGDRIACGTIS